MQSAAKAARERAAGAPDPAFLREQAETAASEEAPATSAGQPASSSAREAAYLAELQAELQVCLTMPCQAWPGLRWDPLNQSGWEMTLPLASVALPEHIGIVRLSLPSSQRFL